MFWMRSTRRVSKREEKAFSLSMLFVLIPLYKPCEKSLLYPLVKKLPTGQLAYLRKSLFQEPMKALTLLKDALCMGARMPLLGLIP